LIAGHEFSERLELYAEIYDLQDANRIGATPRQRAFTLDVGGRQSLNHDNTIRLLFMGDAPAGRHAREFRAQLDRLHRRAAAVRPQRQRAGVRSTEMPNK